MRCLDPRCGLGWVEITNKPRSRKVCPYCSGRWVSGEPVRADELGDVDGVFDTPEEREAA